MSIKMEEGIIRTVISARGFVFNEQNKLLVVSRNAEKWFLPGGWLDELELAKFACEREVYEETGLDVTAEKIVFIQQGIIDNTATFGNILNKFDLFCICSCKKPELKQEWKDSDEYPITQRKFITESEWKTENILAPRQLKEMKFKQIASMSECYSWYNNIPERYKHLIR